MNLDFLFILLSPALGFQTKCKPKPNGENTLLALGDKLLESSLELIFAIAFIILVLKMVTNIHQQQMAK